MKLIEKKFSGNKNFSLNKNIFDIKPIFQSQILITDNGGMALEYTFITRKPVIYINYRDKIHNEQFKKVDLETIEDSFRKKFGLIIKTDQIKNLNDIIDQRIKDYKNFDQDLETFFRENKIEFKNSSDKIVEIIKEEIKL